MLQSYNNPIVSDTAITKELAGNIRAEEVNSSGDLNITWINSEDEWKGIKDFASGYSLEEVETIKQDFQENFNNYHKYPKMTEKDWE